MQSHRLMNQHVFGIDQATIIRYLQGKLLSQSHTLVELVVTQTMAAAALEQFSMIGLLTQAATRLDPQWSPFTFTIVYKFANCKTCRSSLQVGTRV